MVQSNFSIYGSDAPFQLMLEIRAKLIFHQYDPLCESFDFKTGRSFILPNKRHMSLKFST